MTIKEFSKKYGVSKREIDYWTNLGLLHPEKEPENGYRYYGSKSEEEMKKILIAIAMGNKSTAEIKETVGMLGNLPKKYWDSIVLEAIREYTKTVTKKLYDAFEYAKGMP